MKNQNNSSFLSQTSLLGQLSLFDITQKEVGELEPLIRRRDSSVGTSTDAHMISDDARLGSAGGMPARKIKGGEANKVSCCVSNNQSLSQNQSSSLSQGLKGVSYMDNLKYQDIQEQALVAKNKVEKQDLFFVSSSGEVSSEPPIKGKFYPIFRIHPKMWQVQMASLQDFHKGILLSQADVALALPRFVENVESSYAKTLLAKDTNIFEGRQGVLVELGGYSSKTVYGSYEALKIGSRVDFDKLIPFGPGFAGPGHTRRGAHGVLAKGSSYTQFISDKGMEAVSFAKTEGDRLNFGLKKMGTRVDMGASAASRIPIFGGFSYKSTENKEYDFLSSTISSDIYVLENNEGEEIRLEVMPEDFTVEMTQELYGPKFDGENVEFGEFNAELEKVATDGTAYFNPALAERVGLNNSFTFRFAQVGKGLGQLVPELKEQTNSDVIFFGGAVKADMGVYIRRNQLDFGVIMHARRKDSKLLSLSRQVAKRAFSPEILQKYHRRTDEIIQAVMNLEMDMVTQFLSIGKDLSEEEVDEMTQDEIQITSVYLANPKLALQDLTVRIRLRSFLMKQLDQYINGESVIIEEAVWRHMVSDPYTVMQYVKKGQMSVRLEELQRGISRDHTVTVIDGKITSPESVLYRFPFLHLFEARKVNTDKGSDFQDKATFDYYNNYANYFIGMVVYSLRDMQAEAQSGADFDGDTTIVVYSKDIVDSTEVHPYFLDYSLVNGEVVEGAPFEDKKPIEWDFLTEEEEALVQSHNIELRDNGDFIVDELNVEIEELLWKSVAHISMQGLEPGYVGLLSYASDTVVEYATTRTGVEKARLNRFNSFLTVGVRWEIDKAKHGGSFYDELPFLKAVVGGDLFFSSDIEEMEDNYRLVLKPFFSLNSSGVASFTISKTMYYGKADAPKKSLYINSLEHKCVLAHIRNAEKVQDEIDKESSTQFHIISYAKEMIAKGKREGIISEQMHAAYEWNYVHSSNQPVTHPVRFIQRIVSKTASLEAEKKQDTERTAEEISKEISEVRKTGYEFSSRLGFPIPDEYVFALVYESIAKNQYRKTRASDGSFKMSFVSGLLSYFGKQTLAFFKAVEELVPTASAIKTSFIVLGVEKVKPVFNVRFGRTSDGGYVNLEDDIYKHLSGTFVVEGAKYTRHGIRVEGYFIAPVGGGEPSAVNRKSTSIQNVGVSATEVGGNTPSPSAVLTSNSEGMSHDSNVDSTVSERSNYNDITFNIKQEVRLGEFNPSDNQWSEEEVYIPEEYLDGIPGDYGPVPGFHYIPEETNSPTEWSLVNDNSYKVPYSR